MKDAHSQTKLKEYIDGHLAHGSSLERIRGELLTAGWSEESVQMAIGAYEAPAQSTDNKKPKRILFAAIITLFVALVAAASFAVLRTTETPEEVFSKFLQSNTEIRTASSTWTLEESLSDADISAEVVNDFSDVVNPKSTIDLSIKISDENGDLNITASIIAVADVVYVNYKNFDVQYNDPSIGAQIEALGGFQAIWGIDELNVWNELAPLEGTSSISGGDILGLRRTADGINTVLGEMPFGNFTKQNQEVVNQLMNVYTPNYDTAAEERVGDRDTIKYEVAFDTDSLIAANRFIIESQELPQRDSNLLDDFGFIDSRVDSFTIWVDQSTYQPVKVSYEDTEINYSDVNQAVDIQAP